MNERVGEAIYGKMPDHMLTLKNTDGGAQVRITFTTEPVYRSMTMGITASELRKLSVQAGVLADYLETFE